MKEKAKKIYYILRKNRVLSKIFKIIISLERKYLCDLNRDKSSLYEVLNLSAPVIQSGPFKGIKYYSEKRALDALPKIVGTYELELFPVIDRLLTKQYDLVLDVGSAEGYYVIGFAKKWPKTKIIAYDNDHNVRKELVKMLEINNVNELVEVKEFCDEKELLSLPENIRALIISDCEGYEIELFQSKIIKYLKNCDFLIEAHDGYKKIISRTLISRFKHTHTIQTIKQKKRTLKDFPLNIKSTQRNKLASMYEGRGYWVKWLYLESKTSII